MKVELSDLEGIATERVQELNDREARPDRKYILYWMQQSQRAEWNHAFEYAVRCARALDRPVLAVFGLMDDYPEANARHYTFMLQGLQQARDDFKKRDTKLLLRFGSPDQVAIGAAKDACLVVCDRGYLRHQRQWRREVAQSIDCPLVQVESDVVVPVETASDKREYAARTIRSGLMEKYTDFLDEPRRLMPPKNSLYLSVTGEDFSQIDDLVGRMSIDQEVEAVSEHFRGGTQEAKKIFRNFLSDHLLQYDDTRSQPQTRHVSHMSKYLHFGQISPVYLINEIRQHSGKNADSFIEEMLVRRELAVNFCYYEKNYDSMQALPDWAAETLDAHRDDERGHHYTRKELEAADTHDPYWNAAMLEMKHTGYMHNHMRMYWGKQILAWTNTPSYAYQTAKYLNNKYFLDGRDCNSFSNLLWLFGLHDRAWQEREVFGKVRIMTRGGLESKIDTGAYLDFVEQLTGNKIPNREG